MLAKRRKPRKANVKPLGEHSKAGLRPGQDDAPPAAEEDGGPRPVKEEDVYGGVERTRNPRPRSEDAKP